MEIGMTLPGMEPGLDRQRIMEWCSRIEAGPFASLAFGERMACETRYARNVSQDRHRFKRVARAGPFGERSPASRAGYRAVVAAAV